MTVILFEVGSTVEQLNNTFKIAHYLAKITTFQKIRLYGANSSMQSFSSLMKNKRQKALEKSPKGLFLQPK